MRRSTRSRTSRRCPIRRGWSTSSPRAWAGCATCSTRTTTAPSDGIGNYGGGQFELGVGREQNQYLASLFHADAPNDVAPSGFNLPEPAAGLPSSPLAPAPSALGFRWDAERNFCAAARFAQRIAANLGRRLSGARYSAATAKGSQVLARTATHTR